MRRKLFNLLALLSLLLCLAAVGMTVRGVFASDLWSLGTPYGMYSVQLNVARVQFFHIPNVSRFKVFDSYHFRSHAMAREFLPRLSVPVRGLWVVECPHWLTLAIGAVLPAVWIRRTRFGNDPTLCHACGYDLRASGSICPECGAARASA